MYGSYPEITVTARFLLPFLRRYMFFSGKRPRLQKMAQADIERLALSLSGEVS